jgi:hypothetical protein
VNLRPRAQRGAPGLFFISSLPQLQLLPISDPSAIASGPLLWSSSWSSSSPASTHSPGCSHRQCVAHSRHCLEYHGPQPQVSAAARRSQQGQKADMACFLASGFSNNSSGVSTSADTVRVTHDLSPGVWLGNSHRGSSFRFSAECGHVRYLVRPDALGVVLDQSVRGIGVVGKLLELLCTRGPKGVGTTF